MRRTLKEDKGKAFHLSIAKEGNEMGKLTITRRTFLKASAVTGAVTALYSPEMGPLKGLVEAGKVVQEGEVEKRASFCRMCHTNCRASVLVKDGRAIKVEGDPALGAPNFGRVCIRGLSGVQFIYSPTRVKYPLKRVGKRGEGKWERISWEQAVEEIAAKTHELVEKYGPETFVLPGRTGRHDMGMVAHKFARTIGTPNNYFGPIQVCYIATFIQALMFGHPTGGDVKNSALNLQWTSETPYASFPAAFITTNDAIERGMKLIDVDPVYGPTASKADLWLPVRPGSDLALAMGMINVIIGENLYDEEFLKKWSNAALLAKCEPNTYKVATGEIELKVGALLTEADIVEGGSPKRYMFWNEPTNDLKYWDGDEVCWEGGPSGKAHYDAIVEALHAGEPAPLEVSPGSEFPAEIDPALFGAYTVTLKDGKKVECKPAFQLLADNVKEWTLAKTAEITWVPKDRIREAARMLATAESATITKNISISMCTNFLQTNNAIDILKIITGNVENKGGNPLTQFYPLTAQYVPTEYDFSHADGLALEVKRKRLGYYEHGVGCGAAYEDWQTWVPYRGEGNIDGLVIYPDLATVLTAMETDKPYPVKGMFSISSNFLMHDPTLARWLKVLRDEPKVELHVLMEMIMTPSAELADYVLPAVSHFERNYWMLWAAGSPAQSAFGKAIEPLWEAKHDYDFGYLLAEALGKYDKRYVEGRYSSEWTYWFPGEEGPLYEGKTIDEFRDIMSRRYLGIPFAEFVEKRVAMVPGPPRPPGYERHKIVGKFPTDTGKVCLYHTLCQKTGYPPIPIYTEPAESPYSRPDLAKEYPLVLTTGKRQPGLFHSEWRQLPWIREEITREPWVVIHPDTAAECGVEEGDWVWVESPPTGGRAPYNKIMGKVRFMWGAIPKVVTYAQHGWWRPEKPAEEDLHGAFEWNAEALIELEHVDAETGCFALRSQLCKVYKASPQDIEKYKPEITLEQLKALMPLKEV